MFEKPRLQAGLGPGSAYLSVFILLFLSGFFLQHFVQAARIEGCWHPARWSSHYIAQDKEKAFLHASTYQMLEKHLSEILQRTQDLIVQPGLWPQKGRELGRLNNTYSPSTERIVIWLGHYLKNTECCRKIRAMLPKKKHPSKTGTVQT